MADLNNNGIDDQLEQLSGQAPAPTTVPTPVVAPTPASAPAGPVNPTQIATPAPVVTPAPEPGAPQRAGMTLETSEPKTITKSYIPSKQELAGYKEQLNNLEEAKSLAERQSSVHKEIADAYLSDALGKQKEGLNRQKMLDDTINTTNKRIQGGLDEIDARYEDAKNSKVQNFWADKTTGTKVAAAIAIGLGAYGAQLAGSPGQNGAFDIINKAVERDFNMQKANLEQKNKLFEYSKDRLGLFKDAKKDALADLDLKHAASLDTIANDLSVKMAQQGKPQEDINKDTNILAIKQKSAALKTEVGKLYSKEVSHEEQNKYLDTAKADADIAKLRAAAAKEGMSPAQEASEKKIGADLGEWYAKGGASTDLAILRDAKQKLNGLEVNKKTRIAGAIAPDQVRKLMNPDEIAIQQQIERIALRDVKAMFPGSVSDYEGKKMSALSYDPSLSKEQNIKKLDDAIGAMEAADKRNKAMYKVLQKTGKLPEPSFKELNQESATVHMTKNGKSFDIPADQAEEAKKSGYKVAP